MFQLLTDIYVFAPIEIALRYECLINDSKWIVIIESLIAKPGPKFTYHQIELRFVDSILVDHYHIKNYHHLLSIWTTVSIFPRRNSDMIHYDQICCVLLKLE